MDESIPNKINALCKDNGVNRRTELVENKEKMFDDMTCQIWKNSEVSMVSKYVLSDEK